MRISDWSSACALPILLTEAGKFCEEILFPINQSGDLEGCTRHDDGSVTTPKGFKEAYKAYSDAGWGLLTAPEEFGGQGLPHVIGFPVEEYRNAANQEIGRASCRERVCQYV